MSNVQRSLRVPALALVTALFAFSALGTGCSQGTGVHARDTSAKRAAKHAPANETDDAEEKGAEAVVSWSATLDEDAPVLAEFEKRAQAYGCATKHGEDGVLAKCGETPIMVVQKGRKVAVGCQRVTLEDCHALFEQIVSGGEGGAGGTGGAGGEDGGKEPAPPPPGTQI